MEEIFACLFMLALLFCVIVLSVSLCRRLDVLEGRFQELNLAEVELEADQGRLAHDFNTLHDRVLGVGLYPSVDEDGSMR